MHPSPFSARFLLATAIAWLLLPGCQSTSKQPANKHHALANRLPISASPATPVNKPETATRLPIHDRHPAQSEEELRANNPTGPEAEPATHMPLATIDSINDPWFDRLKTNRAIQAAANEWLTWKRPQLLQTWHHYQMLKDRIKPAFDKAGIEEPLFVAIMAQESGGRVHSSSRAGAAGLFQLMPATARRLGLHGSHGDYDLRYSPAHAATATAQFLQEQMRQYNNDLAKVLAAYNSGENGFRRLNKRHKNGDLWATEYYYDLPAETRAYVPQVLAAMLLYKYPRIFNLQLPTPAVTPPAMAVTLPQAASLSQLAVCLGQENNPHGWYRDLRNLNHGIRANRDLPAGSRVWIPAAAQTAWQQQCQNSQLMTLAHQLHQADFPEKPPMVTYVVRAGDALSTIARRFSCTSRREVARLNKIKGPRYLIRVGQKLKIPRC